MVGTVKYTEEFVDQYGSKRWVGIELQYDMAARTAAEMFLEAEAAVRTHANVLSRVEPIPIPAGQVVQVEKPQPTIDMYQQIVACATIEELSTFRIVVESSNNPDLVAVYQLRRKQLIKEETEGIMQKTEELLPWAAELPLPRKKRSLK